MSKKMNGTIACLLGVVLLVVGSFSTPVPASEEEQTATDLTCNLMERYLTWTQEDFQSGRLILESIIPVVDENAVEITNIYEDIYIIQYEDAASAKAAYETFSNREETLSIQPDGIVKLETEEIVPEDVSSLEPASTLHVMVTEDTSWPSRMIGLDVFRAFVLEHYTQLPIVKIAVLDTGIDTDLEAFEDRILDGGKNYCSTNPRKLPEDDHGHGTMVSNIIVDNTFANAQILPIKVMNKEGEGYDSHIVSGFAYAMEYGVDIINLSIGGDGEKSIYQSLIDKAEKKGIAVIVAAGNESQDVDNSTPANIESSITITSVNQDETFSSFSNYGDQVDFCTPGDGITVIGMDGERFRVSGTSFATPFATAAFVNVKSVDYDKSGTEIYTMIKEHAVDLGTIGWDNQFGYGKISLTELAQIYERAILLSGDVNQDDMVNVLDAYLILQYIVGKQELDENQIELADADQDGEVTVLDVLEILQKEVAF